jgi:hypothetical protein
LNIPVWIAERILKPSSLDPVIPFVVRNVTRIIFRKRCLNLPSRGRNVLSAPAPPVLPVAADVLLITVPVVTNREERNGLSTDHLKSALPAPEVYPKIMKSCYRSLAITPYIDG